MRRLILILTLAIAACDAESPTAPDSEARYKEGARCAVLEVVRPRRGEPAEIPMRCRPVYD